MPEPEGGPPAPAPPEAEAPAPETKKKSRIGLIIVIVVAVAAGIVGFLKLRHPATTAKEKTAPPVARKKEVKEVKSVLHLESLVVNLGGSEEKAYLRVGVDVGLSGEPKEEKIDPVLETARVRDTLLTVLAIAKPDELLTIEGKAKLKGDLVRALQERAPDLGVQEVYFTEFLVQR